MDFLTHSLTSAGAARLLPGKRELLPQLSLAAVGATLLIDADPWLYLIDPSWYGFYHRTATHSLMGMAATALASAACVWILYRYLLRAGVQGGSSARRIFMGRFGWFVSDNLARTPARASGYALLAAAGCGVGLHWMLDVITGFGNMKLLWPWSETDFSLHAVYSFDVFIFAATLGWHVAIRRMHWPRRREAWITAFYALALAAYVAARLATGAHTFI